MPRQDFCEGCGHLVPVSELSAEFECGECDPLGVEAKRGEGPGCPACGDELVGDEELALGMCLVDNAAVAEMPPHIPRRSEPWISKDRAELLAYQHDLATMRLLA